MDYVLAVQAPACRISDDCFAIESAFAEHLHELRRATSHSFDRLVVVAPIDVPGAGGPSESLTRIAANERIVLVPMHDTCAGMLRFWFRLSPGLLVRLWQAVGRAGIVHSGISTDIWRPVMFLAIVIGVMRRRRTVFIVDTDFRDIAFQMHKLGIWSRKSYLLARFVYDPLRIAQIRFGARFCPLVLLKSKRLVDDYGRGRPNVRSFFNTAHSDNTIADEQLMAARSARLQRRETPLRLTYFGRLTRYKGLPLTIRAVHKAARDSGRRLELHIIGDGEQKAELVELVRQLDMEAVVRFHGHIAYGPRLFEALAEMDLQIATQLNEDTPRAAFDAMAAGIPIVAFDLGYYRDLEAQSGAVITSPWMDVSAMAAAIVALDNDRARLAAMSAKAVQYARANTQDIWVRRRLAWTLENDAPKRLLAAKR